MFGNTLSQSEQVNASNEALNENENKIVEIIRANPSIKKKDIIELTGISRAQVQRLMKALQERNIIVHEDSKKLENGKF